MKKILARTMQAAAVAGLVIGATGLTAGAASASAGGASLRAAPAAAVKLHFCDYSVVNRPVKEWEYPGGSSRKGNVSVAKTESTPFNSIPSIVSRKVYGQKWIYGELIPYQGGPYGWIGQEYLSGKCGTQYFEGTNTSIAKVTDGDPFSSEPSEISASYRGQTWVWGIDPYATHKAGWMGRKYLTLDSCNSSGCFYNIKVSTREWLLPGGSKGP